MTLFRQTLGAAALLAAFSSPVLAQAPMQHGTRHEGGHAHGMTHGDHGPQRMERMERRLTELKSRLQLTPAQESAWAQFVNAMRPTPNAQHANREAMMSLPTPERIDRMRAIRQQQMARMDQRADATKAFYAALTPQQKQRFDERTPRMMDRQGPSRHGHHGHHG